MRNFVTVAFGDKGNAYKGLHALWQLDRAGEITVHGTAVVHRDDRGRVEVDSKETHPVLATAVGVGIGALLGALAGPAGVAIGIAGGATIGAATGAVIGAAVDMDRSDTRHQAVVESRFVLDCGQSAIIADVSENWTAEIDKRMESLGGTVHRRSATSVHNDGMLDDGFYPYYDYLYPYEYVPSRNSSHAGW